MATPNKEENGWLHLIFYNIKFNRNNIINATQTEPYGKVIVHINAIERSSTSVPLQQ